MDKVPSPLFHHDERGRPTHRRLAVGHCRIAWSPFAAARDAIPGSVSPGSIKNLPAPSRGE